MNDIVMAFELNIQEKTEENWLEQEGMWGWGRDRGWELGNNLKRWPLNDNVGVSDRLL